MPATNFFSPFRFIIERKQIGLIFVWFSFLHLIESKSQQHIRYSVQIASLDAHICSLIENRRTHAEINATVHLRLNSTREKESSLRYPKFIMPFDRLVVEQRERWRYRRCTSASRLWYDFRFNLNISQTVYWQGSPSMPKIAQEATWSVCLMGYLNRAWWMCVSCQQSKTVIWISMVT